MTASKWLMLLTQLTKNLVVSIFSFVSTVSFCRHDQNQDSGAAEPTDRIPVSGAEELRSEAGSILSGAGDLRRQEYRWQSGRFRADGLGTGD